MARNNRIISPSTAAAALALTVATVPAQAAEFSTYEFEGSMYCALDLGGPDGFLISGERGYGATGTVSVMLTKMENAFAFEKELRLEVRSRSWGVSDRIIGWMSELDVVPYFVIPLSLVGELTLADPFTYSIEKRPTVALKGLTEPELNQFVNCLLDGKKG